MNPEEIIALVTALAPIATNLIEWVTKATMTLKQSAELTPEQDAQLDAVIAALATSAAFKIDPDPAPPIA